MSIAFVEYYKACLITTSCTLFLNTNTQAYTYTGTRYIKSATGICESIVGFTISI